MILTANDEVVKVCRLSQALCGAYVDEVRLYESDFVDLMQMRPEEIKDWVNRVGMRLGL